MNPGTNKKSLRNLRAGRTPEALQGRRRKGSDFIGVSRYPRYDCWRARIAGQHLGYFESPGDAARAYDGAARERYGRGARTNF